MYLLSFPILLASLLVAHSVALSDNANQILDRQSTISQVLQASQDAINNYQGGIFGAVKLGQRNYDTWGSLRFANANIEKTKLSSEDSDAIMKNVVSMNQAATDIMNAYSQKAQLLYQARVAYIVPLVMQALYRQSDDYVAAMETIVSEEHLPTLAQISSSYNAAWNACFDKYTSMDSSSDFTQDYQAFYSGILPVMNLLW